MNTNILMNTLCSEIYNLTLFPQTNRSLLGIVQNNYVTKQANGMMTVPVFIITPMSSLIERVCAAVML